MDFKKAIPHVFHIEKTFSWKCAMNPFKVQQVRVFAHHGDYHVHFPDLTVDLFHIFL